MNFEKLRNKMKTTVVVAVNKKIIGIIAIADTLREVTADTVRDIEKMGLRTIMTAATTSEQLRQLRSGSG